MDCGAAGIVSSTLYHTRQAYVPGTNNILRVCNGCGLYSYTSVSTLYLPESTSTIGNEAFAGVAADTIVIPASCTRIGSCAFADSSIVVVRIQSLNVTFDADAFSGANSNLCVFAPAGSNVITWCQ